MKPKGKLSYSPTQKIVNELRAHKRFYDKFVTLDRAGRVKKVNAKDVTARAMTLDNLRSNDHHVVALAIVGNVNVLVSRDKHLQHDFKNVIGGSIYQKATHQHLLEADLCR